MSPKTKPPILNDADLPPTLTIGLVTDFFNPKLLEGARAYAEEHNLQLDARWSVRGDWLPKWIQWDGLLHSLVDQPDLLHRLKNISIPSIGLVEGSAEFCVTTDYEVCGQLAAEELIRCGVSRILIIEASLSAVDVNFARGAKAKAQEENLSFDFVSPRGELQAVTKAISQKICSLPKPLGLCVPHAGLTFTLVKLLMKHGLRIPEDVAIVVVDKDVQQTAAYAPVPLSSVELSEWQRGFVAAETLHQLILGTKPRQVLLKIPPFGIHGRASTGHVQARDPIMAKALSFLRKHYREGIGVPEVVAAAAASRRVVEMRFREMLNCGIHEELTRLRMEDARQLLLEQNLSATDIAEVCGFSSVHYFSAAFKRETGLSPSQFKKSASS